MARYRKKPVIIEAFQLTKEARADMGSWPDWMQEAWAKDRSQPGSLNPKADESPESNGELVIATLEGLHLVSFDDWIIQGVKGELYPCKPDIFAATYEGV